MSRKLSTIGATFIVAGTSIGAGMLGLPVVTGTAGFIPSLTVIAASYLFMMVTGLLYAELALHLRNDANILTMAKTTLGKRGQLVAFGTYLFLFYALLVAYFVGGANILRGLIPIELSPVAAIVLFGALFVPIVMCGSKVVDRINKVSMVGLIGGYLGFVLIGANCVNSELLTPTHWNMVTAALPVAFVSFGYQGVVPTLASWVHYDASRLRRSIVIGTTITLAIYVVWQWLILGIVPLEGENGLVATMQAGRDAVYPLQFFTKNSAVFVVAQLFAFFAIITSFMGVGVSLSDFWADGLKIEKRDVRRKVQLLLLTFTVPLFFALLYPHVFLKALGTAGGFGSALLLGLLPIAMVYRARYKKKLAIFEKELQFLGSKWALGLLAAFVLFEVGCEVVQFF